MNEKDIIIGGCTSDLQDERESDITEMPRAQITKGAYVFSYTSSIFHQEKTSRMMKNYKF